MKSAVICLAALPVVVVVAQERKPEPFDLKAHYTKYEYRIPTRDGVHLFTSIYVPKDTSHPYPFLMTRTPYSVAPYGEDHYRTRLGQSEAFERAGYIFVFQDVRGRYPSEGRFVDMPPQFDRASSPKDVDESTDTYDTIEWLLKNVPNNNGKVGIYGISYPGFFTSASIINSHPAIKAASLSPLAKAGRAPAASAAASTHSPSSCLIFRLWSLISAHPFATSALSESAWSRCRADR